MSDFFVDEGYKPWFSLVVELLAAQWFNDVKKFACDVFLFLVYFVALQVMMKRAWWVSFCDGTQSLLFNENFFGALWITLLQGDWQDFCTSKGWSDEEYILCKLRKKEQVFWWWRKVKWLDFRKTKSVCRILDFWEW